jgi:hypothetical protein
MAEGNSVVKVDVGLTAEVLHVELFVSDVTRCSYEQGGDGDEQKDVER